MKRSRNGRGGDGFISKGWRDSEVRRVTLTNLEHVILYVDSHSNDRINRREGNGTVQKVGQRLLQSKPVSNYPLIDASILSHVVR